VVNRDGGIRGQPVHFVIADDQSQPTVAVQLATAIIQKHVPVLLGSTYVASCLAIAPLVRAAGPVQYCFAPAIHPPAGSYVFSTIASTRDIARALLAYASAKGWHRIATISTTDATGEDVEGQFMDVVNAHEYPAVTVIGREKFGVPDVSIAAQVARLKALAPDAILDATVGTPTGTVLRSLKDAGLDLPVLTNPGNLIRAQMLQYASFLPTQIYFAAPRFIARDVSRSGPVREQQIAFYRVMNAQGIDPDMGHNMAWDATRVVIDALRHLGPNADAKAIRDYILGLHAFAGTDGIFDYRDGGQRGVTLTSLVVARWDPARKTWATVSEPGGKPLR
jgi:branched-chain amino acid transport system substrate-binding protein